MTLARRSEWGHGDHWYQALAAGLQDTVVLVVDENVRFVAAAGAGLAASGRRAEDFLGRTPADLLRPDLAAEVTECCRAALAGEHRVLQRPVLGGRDVWHVRFVPVRDEQGAVAAAMAVCRDVTEQVRATEQFQLLFDQAPIGMALVAPSGRFLQVNPAMCALVGYSAEDLLGCDFQAITCPDDLAADLAQARRLLAGEISFYEMDKRYLHRDGHVVWVHLTVSVVRGPDGVARYFVSQVEDITARRRVELALRDSEERYRRIVELAEEGVFTVDADSRFTFANARTAEMLGYAAEELLGRQLHEFMDADAGPLMDDHLARRRRGERERYDFPFRRRDGSILWAHIAATPLSAADGTHQGSLALISDVTARKRAEAELARLAWHDPLTGLPNRAQLVERIGDALTRHVDRPGMVAVLFIDLDQFKSVNDSLGHAAGDELLALVAHRLQATLRAGDTVARLGGDEFVVVADNLTSPRAAEDLAERILAALAAPISLAGVDVVATASIGIAVTDPARRSRREPGGEWPLSAQALLHDADLAMYQAKASGRACWRVHHPSGTDTSRDRLRLLGELRDALSDDQLRLHYQPRTDLRNATVVGYEALLRWQHPHRGLLGPAEFLPVAEESGLIRELGGWVLREACRTAAGWHAADPDRRPLDIAVNLSARQLADPHLTASVADILTDTGLDPTTLILEVTETAVMRDADTALGVLRALKSLGVRLAIDDFGTGWSSLAYLKRFPVDELKIDRSFVAGLDRDPDDTAIVTSVISLGRAVGVQVLAEGVETHQQRAKLVALDCPLAQGYLFAPPAPADQLPARQPGIPRQSPPAAPDLCED